MKHDTALSRKPSLKEIAHATGGEISGAQVLAPGPGHSSNDRSLSIKVSVTDPDGYVVYSHSPRTTHLEGKDYVRARLGQPAWEPHNGKAWDPVVAEYVYRQSDGTPYLRVQRTASKKFWQQHWTGSEWQNGAPKGARVPYRLPELLSADPAQPIYIVEGEKDADRLAALGFVATTSSGGSNGKWTPELNAAFANRTVYIIPDNDEPGGKYAQRIAQHLHGVAAHVSVVELPRLGSRTLERGKDVSDWLDLGNLAENLEPIAKSAPPYVPPTAKEGWRSHVFTAASLKDKKFDPIYYVLPTLFPEGLTILAGRPKVGKSWMALDIALGLAGGYYILGTIKLEPADVLYAALEDNPRRLRSRIDRILAGSDQIWPERLTLATKWRRLDAGGVADAKEWVAGVKRPKLIIFDTLAGVRPDRNSKDNLYEGDYRALTELQSWANEAGIGVMILHHTRKMESEDPIDSVSGTLGLTGCVDTVSVLARTPKGTTLYIRGRDVEEQEKAIAFSKSTCRWSIQGNAEEVHQSEIRAKIVTTLSDVTLASQPMSPKEIAEHCDVKEENVRQRLPGMLRDGQIIKVSRGFYIASSRADLLSVEPHNYRHNVTKDAKVTKLRK
jgi:5S rRNA maturation endonuclease (ribonuclease M5)